MGVSLLLLPATNEIDFNAIGTNDASPTEGLHNFSYHKDNRRAIEMLCKTICSDAKIDKHISIYFRP